ncbi:MAG: hypothetical protein R3D44_16225 [Hyphomicrobiaceae bacterium]
MSIVSALALTMTVGLACFPAPEIAGAEHLIAGVRPHERPAGAPRITEVVRDPDRVSAATAGIPGALPPSFKFLEHQGGWYMPIDRPGMTGTYDIRGLHQRNQNKAAGPSKSAGR